MSTPPNQNAHTPAADASALERAMFEIKRVIVGQERMVERLLVSLLAAGTACSRASPELRRHWPSRPWPPR